MKASEKRRNTNASHDLTITNLTRNYWKVIMMPWVVVNPRAISTIQLYSIYGWFAMVSLHLFEIWPNNDLIMILSLLSNQRLNIVLKKSAFVVFRTAPKLTIWSAARFFIFHPSSFEGIPDTYSSQIPKNSILYNLRFHQGFFPAVSQFLFESFQFRICYQHQLPDPPYRCMYYSASDQYELTMKSCKLFSSFIPDISSLLNFNRSSADYDLLRCSECNLCLQKFYFRYFLFY